MTETKGESCGSFLIEQNKLQITSVKMDFQKNVIYTTF